MSEQETIEKIDQYFLLQEQALDLHAEKLLNRLIRIYENQGGKEMFKEIALFTGHDFLIKY